MASAIGGIFQGIGLGLSYTAQQREANAARKDAEFQASQLEYQAGQEQAASQRVAADQSRNSRYAQSHALALAAASGGGASDKTVTDVIGRIAQEGSYRSAVAIYEGDAQARQMRLRAAAARITGRTQAQAYETQSMATVLSGGGSLYAKYGSRIPSSPSSSNTTMSEGSYLDAGSESYSDIG